VRLWFQSFVSSSPEKRNQVFPLSKQSDEDLNNTIEKTESQLNNSTLIIFTQKAISFRNQKKKKPTKKKGSAKESNRKQGRKQERKRGVNVSTTSR